MTQNKKIAITGGIGSGKSTALSIVKSLGYPVLSCDEITEELYTKRWVLKEIKKIFPNAVTGKIILKADKKAIAAAAFSDKEKYKKLTEYFSPLIFSETMKKAEKTEGVIFVEVPLLFELGYQKRFDKVFVIKRELVKRIESVKARSDMTEEEVVARINKQFDYQNADLTDYTVIDNNGDKKDLEESIKREIEKI